MHVARNQGLEDKGRDELLKDIPGKKNWGEACPEHVFVVFRAFLPIYPHLPVSNMLGTRG